MNDSKQVIEQLSPHSVSLSTNAKGKVQVDVKCYADDPMAAAIRAVEVLEHLKVALGDQMASS